MSNTEWKKVKLGDIAKVNNGKSIKKSEYLVDGTYAIIGANGEIGRCNDYNVDHPVLTTGRVGTIGTIQMVNKAWVTDNALVIDIISADANYGYVYYTLQNVDFTAITTGNAQPLVTATSIKNIEISLPPIEEQRRIASLLSRFDELIQLHEFKADNLIKAKQQIMSDIFSGGLHELDSINPDDYVQDNWVTVKLGDICTLRNGYSFKSKDYDTDKSGVYKVITIKNVPGTRYISIDSCDTISELPDNIQSHQILKPNDILVSMTGNVGRVSMVNRDNCLLNQRVGLLQLNCEIDTEFLYQSLSSGDFEQAMISLGHGGAQPNIGKGDIEGYKVKIPPTLEEQQKIANLLSSYDSLIELKRSQKQQVTNMKQQLMSQLINNGGEGRVVG